MRSSLILAGLLAIAPLGAVAHAQGATQLLDPARAEQQVNGINQSLSQELQVQQQNQAFQWQLDNQRMRQQINIPRNRAGSATCPAGAVGC